MSTEPERNGSSQRVSMDVDIVCVGFGPATGGFLTTLTQAWKENPGDPAFESRIAPGMPLQVICCERADDLAAGVSGLVTRGQGIRASFPDLDVAGIPMATQVGEERVFYLLDPVGASRRSVFLRVCDAGLRATARLFGLRDHALPLPWTPAFLHKRGGMVLSIGQFNQWAANQVMGAGLAQIWPGMPVAGPLFGEEESGRKLAGVRLVDQGLQGDGVAAEGFQPGMDVRALLTVVGDGPVGSVSQAIDEKFGMPAGHSHRDWALGMKFVIELPDDSPLKAGTVWHTFGYPEPEIFGFLYVHPDRLVSVGIFVPSWLSDPARTAYRYLQHYIQHPALWEHLKDGTLRSWGAKSLEESGKNGEPWLCGDGYARIGENSGSTNMLTGSGVDEAWTTGTQLGEAVLELLRSRLAFTQENLERTYQTRRRASWVEAGAHAAARARNGFHEGIVSGLTGMMLAGLTRGRLSLGDDIPPTHRQILPSATRHSFGGAQLAMENGRPLHDALLSARGWPEIPLDGRLLVTHQDALLMGGKVQAMPGYADHVVFRNTELCIQCHDKTCIAMCSGEALTYGPHGIPHFEREKCVHCGACHWNCGSSPDDVHGNIRFGAGAGGLHSAEN